MLRDKITKSVLSVALATGLSANLLRAQG
ncbi:MAG: hypothetical protein JWP08_411, partial [Bryobacterales bacterium]|nr:hypothetical protein [Bryobacterales bacterium]